MVSLKSLLSVGFLALATASPAPPKAPQGPNEDGVYGCGEVNVFYTCVFTPSSGQ